MSLVEIATPAETAALAVPYSVRLAARRNLLAPGARQDSRARDTGRAERRAHERRAARDLQWLRSARFRQGPGVSLVDLSEGGALLDVEVPLKPGTRLTLELEGDGGSLNVGLAVLRSQVARLQDGVVIYRGACAFEAPVDLARLIHQASTSASSAGDAMKPDTPAATAVTEPVVAAEAHSAWQKIVVRYRDGRLLKGYSQDFHPSRGHFSLWPSLTAARSERVIVPFSRLKAVFFVRDFAGNRWYVEREPAQAPTGAGRAVEVTFLDNEVVRGTTLSYRQDGQGFFLSPADPCSNNRRIFVVSGALRHVRFP